MAAGSALQLVVPFLTQSVVDVGIAQRDIGFVYLILAAQLALFVGRTTVEVLRSWILLHLSTRINISLISDFFIKLMALPIAYFDVKMTGDLMQRINDHQRIERILTTSSLSILFSMVNLVVFSVVLALYSWAILGVFAVGSALYLIWILVFFKKRKALDYKKFSEVSQEQGKVIELINGMQEIKLHNAERQKRWGWEHVQARLFKVTIESLALEQYQSVGSNFINELKNIIITILAAGLVISGELTLGMMVATSYIVGQLNAPIMQLIGFLREWQDAKIAIERLSEIHDMEDEQPAGVTVRDIPIDANLRLKNVSFRYPGSDTPVLIDLNLHIPAKKVTAIVGTSGSGKTTLLKMLLGHYVAQSGSINIGDVPIQEVSKRQWRQKCGVVMQEGYIFNDSVAGNVALGDASIDEERLALALKLANIHEFVAALPQYHRTKIGQEGVGLSTGQKQRLFIARAVYKNPEYLFFDEATSALDANNEQQIMRNLNQYFKNKTVVVVAHRLSTVKNADQIVVLEKGKIAEIGTHTELVALRGLYYELVKNQLELGN
uniref:peptidase domain-containing ABC transporter n=1 Tax=Fulvivirga sp. TaxID=1931237 RepID=UPI0040499005